MYQNVSIQNELSTELYEAKKPFLICLTEH